MKFDDSLTTEVKKLATKCGFAGVAIAPVGPIEHGEIFKGWLANNFHADMDYMAENVEKRLHPEKLVEGARCVICLAVSYARSDDPDPGLAVRRHAPLPDARRSGVRRRVQLDHELHGSLIRFWTGLRRRLQCARA